MTDQDKLLDFNNVETSNTSSIIKVVGVGGGGGNAVDHMYKQGVEHVTYLLCNTDRQHLNRHSIPNKLCIGEKVAKGLGVGGKPELGKQAAEESREDIERALSDGTHMVFINAGMGGGTGTGAAPVIARIAKEMGILTIGIVTVPFLFEGKDKILKALDGLDEMNKNVDAILVINNELLKEVYPDLSVNNAMKKADETLTTATRSITDIITKEDIINLDFADVKSTLSNGGVAVVSLGYGSGDNALNEAIDNALNSPLLNSAHIENAGRILLHVSFSEKSQPTINTLQHDVEQFTSKFKNRYEWIWGYGVNEKLEDKIKVIILASGFHLKEIKTAITDQRDNDRIRDVYGKALGNEMIYSKPNSVIFTDAELDDDAFISLIQDTPTLRRLDSIVAKHRGIHKEEMVPENENEPENKDISPTEVEDNSVHKPPIENGENNISDDDREWDSEMITFGKKQ